MAWSWSQSLAALGESFWEAVSSVTPTWASGAPHRTESYSLAAAHWWQHGVEGNFPFPWSSSYLGTSQRALHKQIKKPTMAGKPWFQCSLLARASHAGIESLLWLKGCVSPYLQFSPGLPHFCCPKLKKKPPKLQPTKLSSSALTWEALFYMLIN